jgi:hypothetical protein
MIDKAVTGRPGAVIGPDEPLDLVPDAAFVAIAVFPVAVSVSAEENLGQEDDAERLPEGDRLQPEQARHEPIPENLDHKAEEKGEEDGEGDAPHGEADDAEGAAAVPGGEARLMKIVGMVHLRLLDSVDRSDRSVDF